MNKRQIGRMSEAELKEALTKYFNSQQDLGVQPAEEQAEGFLEQVLRYRRLSAMLERELVRRVKGVR